MNILTFTPDIPPSQEQLDHLWHNGGLLALARAIAASIRLAEKPLPVVGIGDIMEVPVMAKEEMLP